MRKNEDSFSGIGRDKAHASVGSDQSTGKSDTSQACSRSFAMAGPMGGLERASRQRVKCHSHQATWGMHCHEASGQERVLS